MNDHDLEPLLARALRDESQRGAAPEVLERIRSAGHAFLAGLAGRRAPEAWFSRWLDAAGQAVRGVLLHDQLSGAAVGMRSASATRQRVFGSEGGDLELDLESAEGGDGMVLVRGLCSHSSGGARVLLLEEGAASPREIPCSPDGRFQFSTASSRVDLATSMGSSVLVVDGIDLP